MKTIDRYVICFWQNHLYRSDPVVIGGIWIKDSDFYVLLVKIYYDFLEWCSIAQSNRTEIRQRIKRHVQDLDVFPVTWNWALWCPKESFLTSLMMKSLLPFIHLSKMHRFVDFLFVTNSFYRTRFKSLFSVLTCKISCRTKLIFESRHCRN